MNKVTMTAAGVLAGMVVAGTVGMIVGGRSETKRLIKKTANAARNVTDTVQSKMHMK
jgi:hypothetical protein